MLKFTKIPKKKWNDRSNSNADNRKSSCSVSKDYQRRVKRINRLIAILTLIAFLLNRYGYNQLTDVLLVVMLILQIYCMVIE